MTDLRTAAQQALEAWDGGDVKWFANGYQVMDALRAALEQPEQPYAEQARRVEQETHGRMRIDPVTGDVRIGTPTEQSEQEPVAWVNHGENRITRATGWDGYGALYTHPTRREWRGLSKDESLKLWGMRSDGPSNTEITSFARAIEAALKKSNA